MLYIPQVTKDNRFKYPEAAEEEGIVSALCVPLKAIDRNVGTMRIYTAYEYKFTVDEQNFLKTVADQAAIAKSTMPSLYERVHTLYLVSTITEQEYNGHAQGLQDNRGRSHQCAQRPGLLTLPVGP